ncbi:hypothetical protein SAMN06297129_1931 [Pseudooceanicola antarcticus]|uniref:Uncharacterized protein n=1 Tax=Pseudooceanicola antarcticus TaxID=1247613 RepID=A0A285IRZ0_9RHOB|nr:hypothetical protein [Pseudooceanicola antarcticus]PJE31894.1 hypothetical protein CVM39_01985 [Pseudooceanicola antarcticus]SNY50734.1 hypothetical protein SAMN06297129_1931 [Pseudooceanicola antarcticus]
MSTDLPPYFFRIRDNGAAVFRVSSEDRQRRLGMEQIAVANIRNGDIKPHGDRDLGPEDIAAIRTWMEERREVLAAREMDDIFRAVDHLNQTAHWAQTKASEEALEAVTDSLLMAMHDLRQVLVRKRADRLLRDRSQD